MTPNPEELSSPLVEEADDNFSYYDRQQSQIDRERNTPNTKILIIGLLFLELVALLIVSPFAIRAIQGCVGEGDGLQTDTLLGRIPWHSVVFQENGTFINTDPGSPPAETPNKTVWNDLYPSSWVVVDASDVRSVSGVKMSEFAEEPSMFEQNSEGFGLAVMHQIHCIAVIKHTIFEYRQEGITAVTAKHLDHCLEYLRQVIMCHGDLTLEVPGKNGVGDIYQCRDWDKLITLVERRAIKRGKAGWVRA